MHNPRACLLDVRYRPVSRWNPQWHYAALTARYRERYVWERRLGNVHYWSHDLPIQLAVGSQDAVREAAARVCARTSLVLPCACADERACHRLYMAKLMERLGIGEEVKGKTKLVDGVPVAEVVAKGEAEVGMQQINVILPITGIEYVGPLPPELQDYVVFAAAVLTASKQPEAAITMIRFMADPAAAPLIRKGNMEPPVP